MGVDRNIRSFLEPKLIYLQLTTCLASFLARTGLNHILGWAAIYFKLDVSSMNSYYSSPQWPKHLQHWILL